ncbi:MAG: radical SAM family heme chaperone HemW [Burkholderiaceae bacterium]
MPPLTLYVHTPWCVKKCPYCDFNSHELKGELNDVAYVDALLKDLESVLPQVWGRRVHAVFIGGGTPSLFSAAAIDKLLAGIRARLQLEADAEITLEANPGTVEAERFAAYVASGINRISLGIQSFDDAKLKVLGRIHGSDEAHAAIEIAKRTVGNFNIDLMYALPNQTLEQALADIRAAIAHAPPHLSAYHLTLEPNTLFARYPPSVPDADAAAEIEDAVHAELAASGYDRYEVSAFARQAPSPAASASGGGRGVGASQEMLAASNHTIAPSPAAGRPQALERLDAGVSNSLSRPPALSLGGERGQMALRASPYRSKHNLNYWHFGDYIGIGAGAHGKLSFHDRVVRTVRYKQPKAYLDAVAAGNAVQEERMLTAADLPFEFMLNTLRLTGGFDLRLFTERTGLPLTAVLAVLDQAQQKGLLARDHQRAWPTEQGLRFLNDLTELFLADTFADKA